MTSEESEFRLPQLSKAQRRVLGVLLEKGFTTPENYPLTLKSLTSGANQKSNRSPVTNYSEDQIESTLGELQQLQLTNTVHTAGGRTERFRHIMRHVMSLSEVQLAILAELMLRGRQQMGELRSRASRMVPIPSQDDLRDALKGLMELNYVRGNGPLERRGVEVDHSLYLSNEPQAEDMNSSFPSSSEPDPPSTTPESMIAFDDTGELKNRLETAEHSLEQLQLKTNALEDRVNRLETLLERLQS